MKERVEGGLDDADDTIKILVSKQSTCHHETLKIRVRRMNVFGLWIKFSMYVK